MTRGDASYVIAALPKFFETRGRTARARVGIRWTAMLDLAATIG
jgi:hypothetical protein